MLEELEKTDWAQDFQYPDDYYVLRASDFDTINKDAATAADLASSLQITAQWLKNHSHAAVYIRRSNDEDAWLVLCKK